MSPLSPAERNRLLELLADDMLGMLDPVDAAELAALQARADAGHITYDDIVAGLVLSADNPAEGELPAASAARLKRLGRATISDDDGEPVREAKRSGVAGVLALSGWLAAAAGFLIAAAVWFNRPQPVTPPAQPAEPTLVQRADDLADQPDTIVVPFAAAGLIEGRENAGDLVWNPRLQTGFLRVRVLDENDPAQRQYQLWIFDKAREQYAVDGGVFDVAATQPEDDEGRTIIPFTPALRVSDPAAFAVTLEQPGGVVVTDQSGLVLLAPVDG
ncbi:MAG: anti-sigma factor domain-containing protein [Phycisphaerales bacterium]